MKIEIGPYPNLDEESERKVEIEIHDYDTWNADHTLALIIHPLLLKLKEYKGCPFVDDSLVPDHLKNGNKWGEDVDDSAYLKWEWVIDEMIFAFERKKQWGEWEEEFEVWKDSALVSRDDEAIAAVEKRIENGLILFGTFYNALWT